MKLVRTMKTVRKPSPARSQGAGPRTPIRHKHLRSRSVSSARSNSSGKLAVLIQQNKNTDSFVMSPITSRKSILSDNTEIGEPGRKSWWRKLGESSRDVIELLEENNIVESNNIIEELDIEILSQEKKNYTMDLPESSDSESINSIVIPQRKLLTQKENQPHKKFGEIIGTRETLAKLHKASTNDDDKIVNVVARELFQNKPRSKPIFPPALLNVSPNRTAAEKTKEFATIEPKAQVRNIFGNRAPKRKNIFTNFIVSESEDELPEIQPKVFGFQKKLDARRHGSSSSRGMREPSPASSITTDMEMDEWKMLPSSTMVENQLETTTTDGMSPKRMRLSKLTEIESETGSNATKQSNKSATSKDTEKSRKSKTFTKEKAPDADLLTENKSIINQDEDEEIFEIIIEAPDKSRKSKTFTKEKTHQSNSMTTRNNSKRKQKDDEIILDQNEFSNDKDKSRKSKTFTKEKGHQSDSMTTRNKSKSYENYDDDKNKSSKDKDKSRKSKTFTKEKTANLSSMNNKNNSGTSEDENEIFDLIAQNKSNFIISDQNTSQFSIKTRSQNKIHSPNKSKINDKELITHETISNNNKSKSNTVSLKIQNVESKTTTVIPSQEDDDDNDELNFTLIYEEEEEVPETLQNDKSSRSVKLIHNSLNSDKEKKEVTREHSNSKKKILMEVDENESRCNKLQQITVNHQNGEMPNKSHANSSQQVDSNDKTVVQNNDDSEPEKNYDDEVDMNVSELQNKSKVEKSQDRDEENFKTNEIEDQNKSQEELQNKSQGELQNKIQGELNEVDDEELGQNKSGLGQNEVNDKEIGQNASVVEQNKVDGVDVGQNESEVVPDEVDDEEVGQNKSELGQNEVNDKEIGQNASVVEQNEVDGVDVGQNESEVVPNEDEDEEIRQNETGIEQNEDEDDEISQNESEEGQNESEVVTNEDEDEEIGQNESGIEQNEDEHEEISQNESEVIHNEDEDEEIGQNESKVEQNDNQEESEVIANSDNEHDKANHSQEDVPNDSDNEDTNEDDAANDSDNEDTNQGDVANNSDNEDTNQVESDQVDDECIQDNEVIETSNASHDTTGRNRKKNESPEVILRNSKNHLESFAIKGRNTSGRKTELIKSIHVRHSLESARGSNEFSDASRGSNGEGSGWDSHRTTRKTLRQTYGRDFTPRKSLRALVMEKSAKQTQQNEVGSVTFKFPQANSTELPETSNRFEEYVDEVDENQVSNHEVSLRTRQTTLEMYLQKIKKKHAESRLKLEEEVRNSLNAPSKYHVFKVPAKPLAVRRINKPQQAKSTLFFEELPAEVIEDFKYKPPKRFQPSNAPWITKRLYKFLESKLEAKYDYKARIRAEKLVENMYNFTKDLRRRDVASCDAVDVLKREMARLGIVKTHFDFYEFFHQFMPREVRVKVNPDVVNNISLPRHGVFSDIL